LYTNFNINDQRNENKKLFKTIIVNSLVVFHGLETHVIKRKYKLGRVMKAFNVF